MHERKLPSTHSKRGWLGIATVNGHLGTCPSTSKPRRSSCNDDARNDLNAEEVELQQSWPQKRVHKRRCPPVEDPHQVVKSRNDDTLLASRVLEWACFDCVIHDSPGKLDADIEPYGR